MNDENLIPLNRRTKEEAHALQVKGGQSCSIKKSIAAQIRELKKKGISNANIQKMVDLMENPNASSFNILSIIQEFKETTALNGALEPKDFYLLHKMNLEWHKIVHGEKHKVEATNLNVNMDIAEWEKRLYDGRTDEGEGQDLQKLP